MRTTIKIILSGTCNECGAPVVDKAGLRQTECVRCGSVAPLNGEKIRSTASCVNCLKSIIGASGTLYCVINPPFGHHGDFPIVSDNGWCSYHEFDPFVVVPENPKEGTKS